MSRFKSVALGTALAAAVIFGWVLPRTASADDCGSAGCSPNSDLVMNTEDLDFILKQIKIAERHAAGEDLLDILPNANLPWGLRTVDGSFNNLIPGQEDFGAADQEFPVLTDRVFPDAQAGTSYDSHETVVDSTARLISHLIVNQSTDNPAAVSTAAAEGGVNIGPDIAGADQFFIPNTAPDEGLSAPFNSFMTFFGQFFDHGLDLVNKGGNGVVVIPLDPDDPLFDAGLDGIPGNEDDGPNVMIMPRATQLPGPDGIQGTEDDVHVFINATTPHVDQQQTYASHASSQVLLRHYEVRDGRLQATGRMLNGFGTDRVLDTADDGGMATWDTAQAQGALKLGLDLDDQDGNNVPMILADPYGKFIPGPARGLPQLVTDIAAGLDGVIGTADDVVTLLEGDLGAPVDATLALRVNQSFFLDVAHTANPGGVHCDSGGLCPDLDTVINPRTDMLSGQVTRGIRAPGETGTYDDELLGAHFICGDGRCNENIALTTIHTVFHAEHNRLTNVTKRVLLDAGDLDTLNEWLDTPVVAFPSWLGLTFLVSDASLNHQAEAQVAIDALDLDWNGERVFQAARFGTEMQYNRVVFDEFAPTLAGLKDVFEGFDTSVDPTITAEFSQSVYRFGHSMLTETVDRYDADFNTIVEAGSGDASQLGLFEAFLNPLALYNAGDDGVAVLSPEEATGAVIRGLTRATANEIDEFVTGAMQNNLVGLPLDIGAINIARGRDVGNPPLNAARRMFFETTADTRLMPYLHWADYADNLRHEASLVNFIAAYGTHPTLAGIDGIVGNADDAAMTYADRRAAACAIVGALTPDATAYCVGEGFGTPSATPADAMNFLFSAGAWASDADGRTITGLDDVDFWNGGLAEERMPFGGLLGSTHNYVFETQIEALQNGDRFYYVGRTANIHLLSELESNSFTALVMRNTDLGEQGAGTLSLNIFSVPNHILEVDQSQQFDAAGDGTTADPEGDAELTPLVIRTADLATTNIYIADTTRFIQYTGGDHVTIGGTDGNDTIIGGIGDDTIYGGAGDDRIEGGDGADHIEGGAGDDIITDLGGPDVIEGGDGNDAIFSGNEEDVIFGDAGNDFLVNSSEFGEVFGGEGDDYILLGIHNDFARGGAGDDWLEELGGGENIHAGDNGAAPEAGEPALKGNDVFISHGGNNDFDMESGDDIVVDGPGIERAEGQLGFDWISFQNDRFGVNIDLDLTVFLRPTLPPSNDTVQNRYDRIEGISGSSLGDILRGTHNLGGGNDGNELTEDNMGLIEGLSDLVPLLERTDQGLDVLTGEPLGMGWSNGEIILGGAGSDLMIGKGGNDIFDGDASLKVAISTPNPAIRTGPLGQALLAAKTLANSTASQAELDAAAVDAQVALSDAAAAATAAADAVVLAAQEAVDAAEFAQTGLSEITVTDAIGNLIAAAFTDEKDPLSAIRNEWQAFLDACTAALSDLGFDVGATPATTLAEALAAQAAAMEAETTVTLAALILVRDGADGIIGTDDDSAGAAVTASADLAAAQTVLFEAERAGPDGIFGDDPLTLEVDESADDTDGLILVAGMRDLLEAVFGGFINPGELAISRIISDDDPLNEATDSVVYSGNLLDYTIDFAPLTAPGFIEITDNRNLALGNEGRDLVRNVERLVFADQILVVDGGFGANSPAEGSPTISGTPMAGEILTASIDGVTDADNITLDNPLGAITGTIDWTWQSELEPGSNAFEPIERVLGGGDEVEVHGESLVVTVAEAGLRVRVVATFQDDAGVFEMATSAPVLVTDDLPPDPALVDISIRFATFRTGQDRLRVAGDVFPNSSLVSLYAPGTTADGVVCTGTFFEVQMADGDLEFLFNERNFPGGDPLEVCVSSDSGTPGDLADDLAVSAATEAP